MKSITNPPAPRSTYVEVDLVRLATNYQAIKQAVGRRGIIPVVKANAYGHGLTEVARLFETLQPPGLAVAFQWIRLLSWKRPPPVLIGWSVCRSR